MWGGVGVIEFDYMCVLIGLFLGGLDVFIVCEFDMLICEFVEDGF